MLNVIDEGIDTAVAKPEPSVRLVLVDRKVEFTAGEEIVM
jgi:hypothetical protein